MMSNWVIYILRCADGTLYTGIARDVARRLVEHNEGDRLGARYTRGRRPVVLVHVEEAASRAAATRREREIKKLNRKAKERLIGPVSPKILPEKDSLSRAECIGSTEGPDGP